MAANVPSFKEGGVFWSRDSIILNNLYLLPALTALRFLATIELNMPEGLEVIKIPCVKRALAIP
jgi:hypothetical protein